MLFNERLSYAVYIHYLESGNKTCRVTYAEDAGKAWQWMHDLIVSNGDLGKVYITDVKRID